MKKFVKVMVMVAMAMAFVSCASTKSEGNYSYEYVLHEIDQDGQLVNHYHVIDNETNQVVWEYSIR